MTGFVGLLKVELPDSTAYLTDSGFIDFEGNTYTATDNVLGSLSSVEPMQEGAGGTIPALDLTFAVPDASSLTALSLGAVQRSTVTSWLVEYDPETNAVIGTHKPDFIGQIDQPAFRFASRQFEASLSCVPKLEVLFAGDTGNRLSSSFQKSMFPGETGHDNATGLQVSVAWGVESARPSRGSAPIGASGGGDGRETPNRDIDFQ